MPPRFCLWLGPVVLGVQLPGPCSNETYATIICNAALHGRKWWVRIVMQQFSKMTYIFSTPCSLPGIITLLLNEEGRADVRMTIRLGCCRFFDKVGKAKSIYIYTYTYICVCVCLCICIHILIILTPSTLRCAVAVPSLILLHKKQTRPCAHHEPSLALSDFSWSHQCCSINVVSVARRV